MSLRGSLSGDRSNLQFKGDCFVRLCLAFGVLRDPRNDTLYYELLISGLGNCGMIQSISALGERVCM